MQVHVEFDLKSKKGIISRYSMKNTGKINHVCSVDCSL